MRDEIAGHSKHWDSPSCRTWLEGGDKMGKDVFGMIKDFGARGKIFAVHFRNVSSPMPKFHETLQDDGYLDMYQVMKALREVKCQASLIPDHYPGLVGDTKRRIAEAYSIAYMRALLRRANEEVGIVAHAGASHGVRSRSAVRVASTLMTGAWLSCTVGSIQLVHVEAGKQPIIACGHVVEAVLPFRIEPGLRAPPRERRVASATGQRNTGTPGSGFPSANTRPENAATLSDSVIQSAGAQRGSMKT